MLLFYAFFLNRHICLFNWKFLTLHFQFCNNAMPLIEKKKTQVFLFPTKVHRRLEKQITMTKQKHKVELCNGRMQDLKEDAFLFLIVGAPQDTVRIACGEAILFPIVGAFDNIPFRSVRFTGICLFTLFLLWCLISVMSRSNFSTFCFINSHLASS